MSASSDQTDHNQKKGRRRTAARLAAVQALYEMEISGAGADVVLAEFAAGRWDSGKVASRRLPRDSAFFGDLVNGVSCQRAELDDMIGQALTKDWTLERLEAVLRAILRVGVYEIYGRSDVPPRVVVNEYVDIADAFFSGGEPALVNAVLDRVARTLRPEELAGK